MLWRIFSHLKWIFVACIRVKRPFKVHDVAVLPSEVGCWLFAACFISYITIKEDVIAVRVGGGATHTIV